MSSSFSVQTDLVKAVTVSVTKIEQQQYSVAESKPQHISACTAHVHKHRNQHQTLTYAVLTAHLGIQVLFKLSQQISQATNSLTQPNSLTSTRPIAYYCYSVSVQVHVTQLQAYQQQQPTLKVSSYQLTMWTAAKPAANHPNFILNTT